ncbi:Oligopeptide transport system permease protein OppB [Microbacterium hydrocarbonoxydans]|uniref:Oligopeptide transport system permease protein OppB n=1 Tax=Microbacterium hydrocarbonoxydans TaxID=273678 RepID=A0A0M2HS07_9MICO|nr:ABC transporter permease [Microbacterium hydrocarbonoxydans]KJL47253.1 Oligopeptide transport system permease protein OppB [Microbacterium hydrocarbonoxydans]
MSVLTRTLLARLGGLLLTLVLASIAVFSTVLLTGDPIAALAGGAKPTPELIDQIRAEYHLDDPVWVRYWHWLVGVLQGDFGRSFVYKTDVMTLIGPRFGLTLQLVLLTVVIILVFGVGSGILAATKGRVVDRAVGLLTSLGMALPTFVIAILLIWIFAVSLGWFPVYGAGGGGWDRLWHLILPAVSLAVLFLAYVSRITRSSLIAQLDSEHVDTARVRGIPRGRVFRVHVFRNASPQILAISGTTIAGLFAASAIAEVAFGLGGIGSLLVQAAARSDLPVVQIVSILLVTIFVVLNAVADLVSTLIDPTSVTGGSRT